MKQSVQPAAPWRPADDELIEARPRVADPPLRIPELGRRGKFWPAEWSLRKYDDYARGLHRDGDIDVRPVQPVQPEPKPVAKGD
jgi:hypothetical protein